MKPSDTKEAKAIRNARRCRAKFATCRVCTDGKGFYTRPCPACGLQKAAKEI